ncbi:MAG: hypothetical protein JNJ39_14410 [Blastocatellia bacterium]|nr:hypothetical protein [Blastocatellia bacterium]
MAKSSGEAARLTRSWNLDLGSWIVIPALPPVLTDPHSTIRIPHSVHGDAIVRESHPLSLAIKSNSHQKNKVRIISLVMD